MILNELLYPESIAIIGASNDISKPGGRILKNILDGKYDGKLIAVNPKESVVQGIPCVNRPSEIDYVDLAILAIASKYIPDTIETLAKEKGVKSFIILSAGFSEIGDEGKVLEDKIVNTINSVDGCLIGPNCIGVLTTKYQGIFAGPIPKLEPFGCDLVTGSGATAAFFLETAIPMGITFSSVISVGNSAQIGVEDVLKYWDENFIPEKSSKIKLIYVEQIAKPKMFLRHTRSLINKGCRIAAIKAGTTEAGARAVSSHTGALAGSDTAVDALFTKAGIVRCRSREELAYTAGVFIHKHLEGNRIAVITHAGGPGVMLTDTLAQGGMEVPHIEGIAADELKAQLFHGSSVANPIDFLATGTAEQLGKILDYVDNKFDNIDGSVVIYGTSGLFDVTELFGVLNKKMEYCHKPIYPVMPSVVLAKDAANYFISLGRIFFPDEVVLGKTLSKIYHTRKPAKEETLPIIDRIKIRNIIDNAENGYISPLDVQGLLDASGISRVDEAVVYTKEDAARIAEEFGYPVVMKVVGPIHKSDLGGVRLNINTVEETESTFDLLMSIKDVEGVLIQPMLSGTELFVGAKKEDDFGHLILCGLGGIFVEVLKDISFGLAPIGKEEALAMIRSIKAYALIKGVRGKQGVNEERYADVLVHLSALLDAAPEIIEMDINPLIGRTDKVVAVDARVRVEKV